jgi:regulator of cell morphogenesis and NO signaling
MEQLDDGSTVTEIVSRFPAALRVFKEFGIDTCCGGALPASEAAQRHGVDLPTLRTALRDAAIES